MRMSANSAKWKPWQCRVRLHMWRANVSEFEDVTVRCVRCGSRTKEWLAAEERLKEARERRRQEWFDSRERAEA